MMLRTLFLLLYSALLLPQLQAQSLEIAVTPIISGLQRPTAIAHAGDGSGRLFVLEQAGRVLIYRDGTLLGTPFLDIRDQVGCCGERGLLGLAFHPDYASNGQFYLNYTDLAGDTVVSRWQVSGNADVADAGSEAVLLSVDQPFSNHNGGQLAFGPDGYLYIGLGDGGSGGDPQDNGQNRLTPLGKMLRIDVDSGALYAIPDSNPFAFEDFTLDEIWALGLRNPFRYSFDRLTGDLYIADVGQDAIEEVNRQPANSNGGENYGWRLMEGSNCFNPGSNCNDGSLTLPIVQYSHGQGRCSITGGYVYRGERLTQLQGDYLYGDFCSGEIFLATQDASGWSQQVLLDTSMQISTFGEDEQGELYVASIAGQVARLEAPLSLSPASGDYLQTQSIDLSAILRVNDVSITSLTATLNGIDISAQFSACSLGGTLTNGGRSLRCPDIPLTVLEPGDYTLALTLLLSNGSSVSDSVQWTVLGNIEP